MGEVEDRVAEVIEKNFPDGRSHLAVIPMSGRVGGYVVLEGFDDLDQKERQDKLWSVLRHALKPEEQLGVTMIFTLTPHEFEVTQDVDDVDEE
jgi:hypothetical protein